MINMSRPLRKDEQYVKGGGDMKTITKKQMEMLQIKIRVIDTVCNWLISKLDTAEKAVGKSEERSAKIIKTEAIKKRTNGTKH